MKLKKSELGEFVPVRDGNRLYYGGHQNRLRSKGVSEFFADRSCVVTAFTNVYLYIYKPDQGFSLEEYNNYQYFFYQVLRPAFNGISLAASFDRKLDYLRKQYHLPLKSKTLTLFFKSRIPIEAVRDFIEEGLGEDSPVIVFNRASPKLKFLSHHAATITQLTRTDRGDLLVLSSRAREYRIYLEDLINQNRTYTAFIYFVRA